MYSQDGPSSFRDSRISEKLNSLEILQIFIEIDHLNLHVDE